MERVGEGRIRPRTLPQEGFHGSPKVLLGEHPFNLPDQAAIPVQEQGCGESPDLGRQPAQDVVGALGDGVGDPHLLHEGPNHLRPLLVG